MNAIFNSLNIVVLIILVIAFAVLLYHKGTEKKAQKKMPSDSKTQAAEQSKSINYETCYVQDFLDFDKILSNMIIRDNGTKFTMVIHCSGINFDLMSESEKTMVEEAFIELLNFIQFPVQIYVQTRKVDLKDSLKTYGVKINAIENELRVLIDKFTNLKAEDPGNTEQLGIMSYEIQRKQNLYEYAVDLKKHIERLSVNSNVLQHRYYIAVTYYIEELGMMANFSEAEILEMAYTELYTRCQSITGALMGCDIDAKVLDSNSLAELLYMAFNRDDAEIYRLKDNMEAGFYRLYSTTETIINMQPAESEFDENDQEEELLLLSEGEGIGEAGKLLLLQTSEEKIIV